MDETIFVLASLGEQRERDMEKNGKVSTNPYSMDLGDLSMDSFYDLGRFK
jgi:hypothetical protein